jgi:hypothetical protein
MIVRAAYLRRVDVYMPTITTMTRNAPADLSDVTSYTTFRTDLA